jgi:Holliday junction resolvase RusA-like endonuclease
MLPFEIVFHGPPVSQQTRRRARRRAWINQLREAVSDRWPADEPPALGPISVTITHVYAEVAVDLDNLAKPVLDALKGLVYLDDGQVTDIAMRKRDMARDLRILAPSPVVLDAFGRGGEFLHIRVEEAPDQERIG